MLEGLWQPAGATVHAALPLGGVVQAGESQAVRWGCAGRLKHRDAWRVVGHEHQVLAAALERGVSCNPRRHSSVSSPHSPGVATLSARPMPSILPRQAQGIGRQLRSDRVVVPRTRSAARNARLQAKGPRVGVRALEGQSGRFTLSLSHEGKYLIPKRSRYPSSQRGCQVAQRRHLRGCNGRCCRRLVSGDFRQIGQDSEAVAAAGSAATWRPPRCLEYELSTYPQDFGPYYYRY